MRPKKPTQPPIILWDLRNGRVPLMLACRCGHRAELDPFSFKAPDDMPIKALQGTLRCIRCGERNSIDVGPQPRAWVLYLDRTEQTHRMPWYAGMIRAAEASRERGPQQP